jgi:hypothetical protein
MTSLSQCAACGRYFASVADFDAHRVGQYEPYNRRCMTSDVELADAGFVANDAGVLRLARRIYARMAC